MYSKGIRYSIADLSLIKIKYIFLKGKFGMLLIIKGKSRKTKRKKILLVEGSWHVWQYYEAKFLRRKYWIEIKYIL